MFDVFAVTGAINWNYYDTLVRVRNCFYVLIRIIRIHSADIKLMYLSNKVSYSGTRYADWREQR